MDKLAHYTKQSLVHPWPYDIHIGDDSTISIPASGDIMHTAHLKITWPSDAPPLTAPATALIDFMELLYDGEVIERVYGENMYINNDLEVPTQKQTGLSNLIGPSMTTFYIQLPFTILDTGLPLCALDQQPKLRVVFNKRASTYTKPIKTELLVEYVYIPQKELEYMKTHTLTYSTRSYQRLQFVVPVGTSNVSVLSEFVNDVSELYWVVQNTGADGVYDYGGRESVRSVRLTFNGSDVLVPEVGTGQYLRVVQALQHHARVPSNYYYMYSFVCPVNMSKVLRQQHTINLVENGYERRLTMYAKSLNEFRVRDGIGHMRDRMRESGSMTLGGAGSGYNIVSTVAGTVGKNTPSSLFTSPRHIAYDGQGNVYICDYDTIKRIVISTGAVTTVASGFNNPYGIVYDGQGNLYISFVYNRTISKMVISSGVITTIAGLSGTAGTADGFGSAARFNQPTGIAYAQGSLYICDLSTIRRLFISTAEVTTVASGFNQPFGIAYDGNDSLYICDTFNRTIKNLVISTSAVTTIAGSSGISGGADGTGSAARFNGPNGITYDGQGNLYICDPSAIRKLVIVSGLVSTIAGLSGTSGTADGFGSAARFSNPSGILYDGNGRLYISDTSNNTIRRIVISTSGVTTFHGLASSFDGIGSDAKFYSPLGIGYDGQGNLFITDSNNNTVRKLVIATQEVTTFAGLAGQLGSIDGIGANARFYQPQGIVYDGQGNLYISDTSTIRKIVISTQAVTTIAGLPLSIGSANGTGSIARFNYPNGIAYAQGNLYICDTINHTIRKLVISTSTVTTIAGLALNSGTADGIGSTARFNQPKGIAYDGNDSLYISDGDNYTIRKLVIATGQVTTIAGLAGQLGSNDGVGSAARFSSPYGITYDGQGNLFISDAFYSTVRRLVIQSKEVTTFAGSYGEQGSADGGVAIARFVIIYGITYDGKGNLFICDTGNYTIRKIIL